MLDSLCVITHPKRINQLLGLVLELLITRLNLVQQTKLGRLGLMVVWYLILPLRLGVIISVYAGMLYNGWSDQRDLHAITVTSVKKDRYGNVLGFYVCDSGTGGIDSSKFYTTFQVENALSCRPMNVTSID